MIECATRQERHGFESDNVTDHAGGARDSTMCEDVAAASRASDCYDFPLPTGDDPPCHAFDGCPAGGSSFLRRHHDTRWPHGSPVRDAIHPDLAPRANPSGPVPSAIRLALRPTRLRVPCERPLTPRTDVSF